MDKPDPCPCRHRHGYRRLVVQSSVAKQPHPHLMRTVPLLGDADTDRQQSAGNPIPVAEADRSTVSLSVSARPNVVQYK